ncbi:26S protease regulatory subunit 6A [Leucoagaricus sp. SymC.cos]|nr:26S protease regulatory subunit 6A [Leucoagaricus sp. SymC.cos]
MVTLTHLAPGAINVGTTLVALLIRISVGRLTSQIVNLLPFLATQYPAAFMVRLEMIEHSHFGLKLPSDALVTLPSIGLGEFDGNEASSIANDSAINQLVVLTANQSRSTNLVVAPQGTPGYSVSLLSLTNSRTMQNIGTSTYLFTGGNSTFSNNHTSPLTPFAINLDNLPALYLSRGVGVTANFGLMLIAPLVRTPVYNLHMEISGGRVRISNGTVDVISLPRNYDTKMNVMELDFRLPETDANTGALERQIEESDEAIIRPTGSYLGFDGLSLDQMPIVDVAKLVRDTFAVTKKKAPAFISIDGLDAVGVEVFNSEKGNRKVQPIVLELLNQLDGLSNNEQLDMNPLPPVEYTNTHPFV